MKRLFDPAPIYPRQRTNPFRQLDLMGSRVNCWVQIRRRREGASLSSSNRQALSLSYAIRASSLAATSLSGCSRTWV